MIEWFNKEAGSDVLVQREEHDADCMLCRVEAALAHAEEEGGVKGGIEPCSPLPRADVPPPPAGRNVTTARPASWASGTSRQTGTRRSTGACSSTHDGLYPERMRSVCSLYLPAG